MRKIKLIYPSDKNKEELGLDWELGECQGFFDEEDNFLCAWDMNDAQYRTEYMNPLFEQLGIKVFIGESTKDYTLAIAKSFGFEVDSA